MATEQTINFTRGLPADESYPAEELVASAEQVLRGEHVAALAYGPALGYGPLREWLAAQHRVETAQVLTTNGSLHLIEMVSFALLTPGDVVFTESPSYDRTLTLFRRHGVRVVGIPLEADGPDLTAFERELGRETPKLVYLIPDFQNPSGATCSGEKRRRVAELAERHGFLLLEDAPYRSLRYRGDEEPTLRELAPARTLHMSSFTKLIAPGVRCGFAVGEAALIAKIAKVAEDTYISPTYLAHAIVADFCRRGLLPPQIERLKRLYAPRLEACLAAIDRYMPEATTTRPDGGFFISLTLPPGVLTTAVRAAAAKRNLNLSDGLAFFPWGGGERFVRLPFCALTPAEIEEGVRRLAAAIGDCRS